MSSSPASPRLAQTFVKVGSEYYVLASSLASRRTTRVLADGRSFAIFDASGDIIDSPLEALGFFNSDTRHLARFEMLVAGETPYYLNSYLGNDREQFRSTLTNTDLRNSTGAIQLPRNSIRVERGWVLRGPALFHRLTLRNYVRAPIDIELDFFYGVDFADVFEVRGIRRERRGEILQPKIEGDSVTLRYLGLDKVERTTELKFNSAPSAVSEERATFKLHIDTDQNRELECRVTAGASSRPSHISVPISTRRAPDNFAIALSERQTELATTRDSWASISSSNGLFTTMLRRAMVDLTSMISEAGDSAFMMAGIPWFATLFGRDSIITALSILPFYPELATRTLKTLARVQGTKVDEARDEQPGKIVHEIRAGEMAATGEIPFGRYYGSIDSTPLFLWLYGRCIEVTGDLVLADQLWPHAQRAIEWIERYGDLDGDGYIEYLRESPRGLVNQGWKDSYDAISHRDGQLARPPIALAEVQGYVYAACTSVAAVAARLGHSEVAARLAARATALKRSFERDFWLDEEGMVALALDVDKRPCRVMSSNGAHCLATGLIDGDRAAAMCRRLLDDDMFTGWGIRTLSRHERRYNPMSYHNGSVWPHDTAIAALGLARGGDHSGVITVLEGLVDASAQLQCTSLPELFCGFRREPSLGPVPYPVACHPQAWSAASVFLILQAMLGMRVLGFERRVVFESHLIPSWLDWLRIDGLRVGQGSVSFVLARSLSGSAVEVKQRSGGVRVEV
jgi:glycogen debranching enzyme